MPLELVKGDNPKPYIEIESRPPTPLTPHLSFWVVLRYKHHAFDRMLPEGFMGCGEAERDLILSRVTGELQRQLRPILEAEDQ